ncbi:MAG TPA: hypothetical protein VIV60_20305 [Polyangiaceae bacterium]
MSRTKRRPYSKRAQQVSKACRNHGGCERCASDRQYAAQRALDSAIDSFTEYFRLIGCDCEACAKAGEYSHE